MTKATLKGSYSATIAVLENVRKHPNADRLLIATVLGYNVIVGQGSQDGDIGVLFPEGGRLSHEMGLNNTLYRKHPETGEPMGGYMSDNLRVTSCKLRGQISEALFLKLDSLQWTSDTPINLKVGDTFDYINGKQICTKYFNKATLSAIEKAKKNYRKPKWLPRFMVPFHKRLISNKLKYDPCPDFKKHIDTAQLRNCAAMLPPDMDAIFTIKTHGTSQRSGYVRYDNRSWWQRLLKLSLNNNYVYILGTRNTVRNPFAKSRDPDFREIAHKTVIAKGLKKNEVIYYEILGFENETRSIMPDHKMNFSDFKDKGFNREEFDSVVNKYGETITYHYGCQPGTHRIEVYRIVQDGKDLSDQDMRERCMELDISPVGLLGYHNTNDDLLQLAEQLANQNEGCQIREGVAVRIENNGNLYKILKYKSFLFTTLEGIQSNLDYVNLEEIS